MKGLYYPCSENKGTDQLCNYCTADLRLCFRICKLLAFSRTGSFMFKNASSTITLISLFALLNYMYLFDCCCISIYTVNPEIFART